MSTESRGRDMRYFDEAITLEEVKQLFKKYARDLHPDNNQDRDTTKDFQEMKKQYEEAFNRCKNTHKNAQGETYTKESNEAPEEYASIIESLLKCKGLSIELCGSWLWITGNTKEHKDTLKALHFAWSKNKSAWYFHFEPFKKRSKKSVSLDEIRGMYGSERFTERTNTEELKQITA